MLFHIRSFTIGNFISLQSNDTFVFQEFSALDQYNKDQVNNFNHLPFTGNPTHVLIDIGEKAEKKEEEKKEDEQSEDEDIIKIDPKNFIEIDRLHFVVRSIEQECQLAPIGGYRMN